jgi:hypothetical protein
VRDVFKDSCPPAVQACSTGADALLDHAATRQQCDEAARSGSTLCCLGTARAARHSIIISAAINLAALSLRAGRRTCAGCGVAQTSGRTSSHNHTVGAARTTTSSDPATVRRARAASPALHAAVSTQLHRETRPGSEPLMPAACQPRRPRAVFTAQETGRTAGHHAHERRRLLVAHGRLTMCPSRRPRRRPFSRHADRPIAPPAWFPLQQPV